MVSKNSAPEEKSGENSRLQTELGVAWAAIGREDTVIHDFVKRLYTGYTSLMRAQPSRYRDWLNTVLIDAWARWEYLGGFPVRLEEDGRSHHHGNKDNDEEREGRTPPPEGGEHGDFRCVPFGRALQTNVTFHFFPIFVIKRINEF